MPGTIPVLHHSLVLSTSESKELASSSASRLREVRVSARPLTGLKAFNVQSAHEAGARVPSNILTTPVINDFSICRDFGGESES